MKRCYAVDSLLIYQFSTMPIKTAMCGIDKHFTKYPTSKQTNENAQHFTGSQGNAPEKHLTGWPKLERLITPSIDEDREPLELTITADGSILGSTDWNTIWPNKIEKHIEAL